MIWFYNPIKSLIELKQIINQLMQLTTINYSFDCSATKESYLDGGGAMTDWPLLQEKVYYVFSTKMDKYQKEFIVSYSKWNKIK